MSATLESETQAAAGEARLAPSTVGSVVLDVGGDVGALVVPALAEQCGQEIELVPEVDSVPLTHTEVRERRLPGGTVYAAVFPGVSAGDYRLRTAEGLEAPVTIAGGEVATAPWPGAEG
jgi:hypothetical protein